LLQRELLAEEALYETLLLLANQGYFVQEG